MAADFYKGFTDSFRVREEGEVLEFKSKHKAPSDQVDFIGEARERSERA